VDWRQAVAEALESGGGIATRQQLLTTVPKGVLDGLVGRRALQRLFPHVYTATDARMSEHLRLRAALLHAGPVAAVSHTSALTVWGLLPLGSVVHLTVDESLRRAGAAGLVVHRRLRFRPEPPQCVVRQGLPVTALARSLVDAWPLLPADRRRPSCSTPPDRVW
jgi:hypothetical protein